MVPLLALLLLLLAAPAHATLISADSRLGPDTITVDTLTGLRWLDLTETLNTSSAALQKSFERGGELEGFRYATIAELCGLATDHFGRPCGQVFVFGADLPFDLSREFVDLFGPTNATFSGNALLGVLDPRLDEFPQPQILSAFFHIVGAPDNLLGEGDIQAVNFPRNASATAAAWLIQETEIVPGPWSLALLALGLPLLRRR